MKGHPMPNSKKPTRKRGITSPLPKAITPAKPGFDPTTSKLPKGRGPGYSKKGGKPMLFPGRTGGR